MKKGQTLAFLKAPIMKYELVCDYMQSYDDICKSTPKSY